jgi:hypothetical protein
MEPNERTEQKRIVVDSPGTRHEVTTERTQKAPEPGPSLGTIAVIALIVVAVVGIVLYVITNRNANEAANRNANIDVASQTTQPAPVAQQPASQAPIIIQQPAQQQPAPVIIQQPAAAPEDNRLKNDLAIQEAAVKILLNDPDMSTVSIAVSATRAALTGTVNSERVKERAERLVKTISGVTAVDNKIYVAAS